MNLNCYRLICVGGRPSGWLPARIHPDWCVSCCAGADHTGWNLPQQVLVPAEISLWICCTGSCSDVFRSWPLSVLVLRPLGRGSGTAYGWLWATRLELQSGPWFVAASAGPRYVQEGPCCAPRLAFTSTGPGGRTAEVPRNPEIGLCLPPSDSCLLESVTARTSGNT